MLHSREYLCDLLQSKKIKLEDWQLEGLIAMTEEVCNNGISIEELYTSKSRKPSIIDLKFLLQTSIYQGLGLSQKQIGKVFERDRTCILRALGIMEYRIPAYQSLYLKLISLVTPPKIDLMKELKTDLFIEEIVRRSKNKQNKSYFDWLKVRMQEFSGVLIHSRDNIKVTVISDSRLPTGFRLKMHENN